MDYQQYWRLLRDKMMIEGIMDYDLKILYPVKISLYKDKKKKKGILETHSGLEILHPCTLRKVVNKVLKKTIPNKNLCMENDKDY